MSAVFFFARLFICVYRQILSLKYSTHIVKSKKPLHSSTLQQLQKKRKKCLFDRHVSEDSPSQTLQFCTVNIKQLCNEYNYHRRRNMEAA